MKIRRTVPPTAAPIESMDLARGFAALFSGGKKYREKLDGEIKEYFGVRRVWCVSSGKAALALVLSALKESSKRKRVVIPAYTCFSVPSAIVKAGLEVTLCDIDPATFDFDPRSLEMCIDEETLCVVPNHLFGLPCNLDFIARLCRERGAYLVEDAAQAMGGTYKGKKLGTIGDAGFFSLGRGKNLTCGSGGILVTNSSQLAPVIERLYAELEAPGFLAAAKEFLQLLLMAVFIRPMFYWFPDGLPFLKLGETLFYREFSVEKLSGMKAGCLWNWPKRLETANRVRSATAGYFRERLPRKKFSLQPEICYLRLPLLLARREIRDRFYAYSRAKGLGLSRMYPAAINEIEEIKGMFDGKAYPGAKEVAERLLTLPTHHLMTERDKEAICALFRSLEIEEVPHGSRLENRQSVLRSPTL
jgi:dTDP-4-amino-4,6-dideoxygalactose transaminase